MNFQKRGHNMPDKFRTRERYGEAFWRKHHEAWQQSALNQREYCEAQGIPLKAFGNWRAKFKAEPQPPLRKLLYRRGGPKHHPLSHPKHKPWHITFQPFAALRSTARGGAPREVQQGGRRAR